MDIHINKAHNNSALPTILETYKFKQIKGIKDKFFFLRYKQMQI